MDQRHDIEWISGTPIVKDWDWWNGFLQSEYYGAETERDGWRVIGDSIARDLNLQPGMRIVDLGAGCGELALHLARRGMHVTGVEASSRLVDRGMLAARAENLDLDFVLASMFEWEPDFQADAVVSINTSFGYGTNEQNLALIARISEWLCAGGAFYLDTVSADRAESFGTWSDDLAGGRLVVDNTWDPAERTMTSHPTWVSPDRDLYVSDSPEVVRIYRREDIEAEFEKNGLTHRRLRRPMGRDVPQDASSLSTTWVATKS